MSNLVLFLFISLLLILLQFNSCLYIGIVVTAIVFEFLLVEVYNVVTDAIHKVLRVRDDYQYSLVLLKFLLEPDTGLEIKMIGWFVE